MAASVRIATSSNTGGAAATTLATTIGAGTTTNDVMYLGVHVDGTVSPTTPTGWTLVTSIAQSTVQKLFLYMRVWQSGDAGPTVALNATVMAAAGIVTVQGADTTEPTGGTGTASAATATNIPPANVQPTVNNGLNLAFIGFRNAVGTTTITPATYAEDIDTCSTATPFIGLWEGSRSYPTAAQTSNINQSASRTSTSAKISIIVRSAQNGSDITMEHFTLVTGQTTTATTPATTTTRANQMMIAIVKSGTARDNHGVSGAGLTWRRLAGDMSSKSGGTISIWGAWAASALSAQTFSGTGTGSAVSIYVMSYYGGINNLNGAHPSATGTTNTPSVVLRTTAANSLVVGAIATDGNSSTPQGSNVAITAANEAVNIMAIQQSAIASAGTDATISTLSNDTVWDMVAYEVLSAAPANPIGKDVSDIQSGPSVNSIQAPNRVSTY